MCHITQGRITWPIRARVLDLCARRRPLEGWTIAHAPSLVVPLKLPSSKDSKSKSRSCASRVTEWLKLKLRFCGCQQERGRRSCYDKTGNEAAD